MTKHQAFHYWYSMVNVILIDAHVELMALLRRVVLGKHHQLCSMLTITRLPTVQRLLFLVIVRMECRACLPLPMIASSASSLKFRHPDLSRPWPQRCKKRYFSTVDLLHPIGLGSWRFRSGAVARAWN